MSTGIRLDYDYVKEFFADAGCELLEDVYKNARTKLRYRCLCGNESSIVFDSFQRGNRCKQCGNRKISATNKGRSGITQEYVVDYFRSQGCELLDIYEKSSVPMRYRCKCGTVSMCNWNNFLRGRRCKQCLRVSRSGSNNYQWIPDREAKREYELFKQRCYKLLKIALNAAGKKKDSRTEQMLGYTVKQFQEHIRSFPQWGELQNSRWHVDHIFPIKAFVDYGVSDIRVINALDNLQPLGYKENISKSGNYDQQAFEKWLLSKGITPKRQS